MGEPQMIEQRPQPEGQQPPQLPDQQTIPSIGGVDPSDRLLWSSQLKKAAYFPLFSAPHPSLPNIPLFSQGNPHGLVGMKINQQMHRSEVGVGSFVDAGLPLATTRVGQAVADMDIDWRLIPDDFIANPGVFPPPTELDSSRSQRFATYGLCFRWKDREGSTLRCFGAGRTFPSVVGGQAQLRLCAVVEILEGSGRLSGVQGCGVFNGSIESLDDLALNVVLRIMDPAKRLRTEKALSPLRSILVPDPTATLLVFLGEPDPQNPITLEMASDGHITGACVHELLRRVDIDFDIETSQGMRSKTSEGEVVGLLSFRLKIDSTDRRIPTPFQTSDALFTFFDPEGRTIGTLNANVVEGRSFQAEVEGVPPPIIRLAGFGPLLGGSGVFSDVSGMLAINGISGISARTPSILYVLRVSDPDGRFRCACS